ncbi:hypothetical protein PENTCL1PPCAC_6543 [Pristionchus entomophagus]|uniref:Uncharacterized protein n=1 Tax=Pristionchus entomophagus TaxID=358040 RepID=A0AAV5SQG7_9BILA|nr:hypothetical protein PENTCL1PPCAC_6543 [Pristionchus entomophagus]
MNDSHIQLLSLHFSSIILISDSIMIGMMNAGTDSVEFYTPRLQSSLYRPAVKKSSYTYTIDGRVLYNGHSQDSLLLWRQLFIRVIMYRLLKDLRKSESGFLPALRRFSQRIGLTRKKEKTSIQRQSTIDLREELQRPIQLQLFSSEPSRIPDRPPPRSPCTPSTPSVPFVTHV